MYSSFLSRIVAQAHSQTRDNQTGHGQTRDGQMPPRQTPRFIKSVSCLSLCLLVCACDMFSKKDPLPGQRESYVRFAGGDIVADPVLKNQGAVVPASRSLQNFPQGIVNFDYDYRPYTADLSRFMNKDVTPRGSVSIGDSVDDRHRVYGHPVSDGRIIYVSDSRGRISAVDVAGKNASDPKVVWTFDTIQDDDRSNAGCATLALHGGRVFVGTALGDMIALDGASGKVVWRVALSAPIRVMPAVKDGRVFITLMDGKTLALDVQNGRTLWMYQGFVESASIQGGATPVVKDDVVVSSYSSGDVHVMKVDSEVPLWSDTITAALRSDSVSSLPHIVGNPILEGSMLYVVSHGGRMAAFDLSQGLVVWQKELGSVRSPLMIGQNIYVLDNSHRVICLDKVSGRVYWVQALPYQADDVHTVWADPIAVNDQLLLTSSLGDVVLLSLKNGAQTRHSKTSVGVSMMPIVVGDRVYMVNNDGVLQAY